MAERFATDGMSPLPPRTESRWVRRVLLFATMVLLVDALFGDRGLRETLHARERYDRVAAELRELRRENAALQQRVRDLTQNARSIEAEARRELGLIKPGEFLFVVRAR